MGVFDLSSERCCRAVIHNAPRVLHVRKSNTPHRGVLVEGEAQITGVVSRCRETSCEACVTLQVVKILLKGISALLEFFSANLFSSDAEWKRQKTRMGPFVLFKNSSRT